MAARVGRGAHINREGIREAVLGFVEILDHLLQRLVLRDELQRSLRPNALDGPTVVTPAENADINKLCLQAAMRCKQVWRLDALSLACAQQSLQSTAHTQIYAGSLLCQRGGVLRRDTFIFSYAEFSCFGLGHVADRVGGAFSGDAFKQLTL